MCVGMRRKKAVNLYLDEVVCKEAKEAGLNLSIIAQNAIKEAINRLKGAGCQNAANVVVRGTGFEPANPYGTSPSSWHL